MSTWCTNSSKTVQFSFWKSLQGHLQYGDVPNHKRATVYTMCMSHSSTKTQVNYNPICQCFSPFFFFLKFFFFFSERNLITRISRYVCDLLFLTTKWCIVKKKKLFGFCKNRATTSASTADPALTKSLYKCRDYMKYLGNESLWHVVYVWYIRHIYMTDSIYLSLTSKISPL